MHSRIKLAHHHFRNFQERTRGQGFTALLIIPGRTDLRHRAADRHGCAAANPDAGRIRGVVLAMLVVT
jgi:hypothetical protein